MKTTTIQIFSIAIEIGGKKKLQKYFTNYSSANTMEVLIRCNSQNSCLEQKRVCSPGTKNIRTIVSILLFKLRDENAGPEEPHV